jgi:hypothetical protein
MDGSTKIILILFILVAGIINFNIISKESDDKIQAMLDESTQLAIKKGEFQLSSDIVPIESKDCEGTRWIKQQGCSLNGKVMDGTEDSCGPGKEIWILDPNHKDFKPATGDGKCEPQQRDCNVTCPKPCEGDTWKNTGKCIRKEYDIRGNVKVVELDGTEGKCGEGITELNLDTNAPDYKPAVGSGSCVITKGGYCNVPCPKPEPPKCNSYTGWVENVGLGCVRSRDDQRKVICGQKGEKMFFNIATDAKNCAELVKWEECTGAPCPINCEGSWSKWSAPKSDEPCGVQPYKERIFTITKAAQHGGYACDYPHGDTETRNSGIAKDCCIENNDWAMKPGTCGADGLAVYTQTYKENKVGGCPAEVKSKKMACCYQKDDWTDTTKCNSVGIKTQKQTTAGNCPSSVKTRKVDCKYISEWVKIGGCSSDGKQTYTRTVVNGDEKTQKTEDCCIKTPWVDSGSCKSDGKQTQTRTIKNCPGESSTQEVDCCYPGAWTNSGPCKSGKQTQTRTLKNCPSGTSSKQEVDCCDLGAWTNSGSCKSTGKQTQTRTLKNCPSGTSSKQEVPCEYIGEWKKTGGCRGDGTQMYYRTVINSKLSRSKTSPCCYKTPWANVRSCKPDGKQTQKRTVKNCPGESSTQEVDCCFKTAWVNSGSCKSDGKQTQKRTVKNCPGESSTQEVDCCYMSGWSDSGSCKSNGTQTQKRTVKNCPTGTLSTQEVNCCYKGEWGNWEKASGAKCVHTTWNRGKIDVVRTRKLTGTCPIETPTSETSTQECNNCVGQWEEDGYEFSGYNRAFHTTPASYNNYGQKYVFKHYAPVNEVGKYGEDCKFKVGEKNTYWFNKKCYVGGSRFWNPKCPT